MTWFFPLPRTRAEYMLSVRSDLPVWSQLTPDNIRLQQLDLKNIQVCASAAGRALPRGGGGLELGTGRPAIMGPWSRSGMHAYMQAGELRKCQGGTARSAQPHSPSFRWGTGW